MTLNFLRKCVHFHFSGEPPQKGPQAHKGLFLYFSNGSFYICNYLDGVRLHRILYAKKHFIRKVGFIYIIVKE